MQPHDEDIDAQLRAAILAEPADTTALDARVREQMNRSRIARGKWIAAAGIAAVLALLIGGYWLLPNRNARALCSDAARDHRAEVIEHQKRTWLTDPGAIDGLAARQGIPPVAAAMFAPAGYRLERGRLCRLGGQVFLHLVYSDGAHEFSFFLRDRAGSERAPVMDLGPEHVAPVESQRFTALVVTDESHDAALNLAGFMAGFMARFMSTRL